MTILGEQGATAEERFGSLDVMSRLFDSLDLNQDGMLSRDELLDGVKRQIAFDWLDLNQDGMLSRDELLDGLRQQIVGNKTIATLQKAFDTDRRVSKEEWKAALEQAAPALQAASAALQAAGKAALDLAGIVDILNIVHTRPPDADFAQLHQWKSLIVTRRKSRYGRPCLVFGSTEGELQFGWPVYKVCNEATPSAACTIPKTEERGISPRQLLALWQHIKTHCVKEVQTDNYCRCRSKKKVALLLFEHSKKCSVCNV